jgi:general secretion pathway protein I
MRSIQHHTVGFTLLEILVAFIVLAIVGGALLQLFQGGMRNITYASEYSHAALLARSKLAELEARSDLLEGEEEGSFDEQYRWRLVLVRYIDPATGEPPQAPLEALQATLSIAWGEGDETREYAVDTLLLAAPAEEGGP